MSRSLRLTIVALCALLAAITAPAAASARQASRTISYRGGRFVVPRAWPVYNLAADPRSCVRFDRPAVYVGEPSSEQECPVSAAVGRNEAILIEPDGRGAVVRRSAAASSPLGEARAGLRRALERAARSTALAHSTAASPPGPYTGLGFDPCSTPSMAHMAAWLASPFRAVGIYIGGTNMGCAQPNLDIAWVQRESAVGWHLIPTYVGLQAPVNSCGCAAINPSEATGQGSAAATDAAGSAYSLGIGRGNPIYLDVEDYPRTQRNTSAVLEFVAGWTSQLHAYGYRSGVYGNSDSLMADLVNEEGTSYPEPDDIWFAEWNGQPTAATAWVPPEDWSGHRLHQFRGDHNARYGGVTINIDSDYLDGDTAGASTQSGLIPDGTFVQEAGTQALYRVAGGAPLLVSDWSAFGGPQPYKVVSPQQFAQLNTVPVSGTFLETSTGAIYRVAGGAPLPVSRWSLFGGPQPAVGVDEWDVENVSNPAAHLNATPADGTIVEGLPSHTYWVFEGGSLTEAAVNPFATQVDDAALAAFPELPCVVPSVRRMKLARARTALLTGDCRLGTVQRLAVHRRRRHIPWVIAQSPAPGTQEPPLSPVDVTMR